MDLAHLQRADGCVWPASQLHLVRVCDGEVVLFRKNCVVEEQLTTTASEFRCLLQANLYYWVSKVVASRLASARHANECAFTSNIRQLVYSLAKRYIAHWPVTLALHLTARFPAVLSRACAWQRASEEGHRPPRSRLPSEPHVTTSPQAHY